MSGKHHNLITFGCICYLVLFQLVGFYSLVMPVVNHQLFAPEIEGQTGVIDFVHFYQCGAMAGSPERYSVYNPQVQHDWTNRLISPEHIRGTFYIQYMPFVFPLMLPLTKCPMVLSYVVWSVLSLVLGTAALCLTARGAVAFGKRDLLYLCLGTLASVPSMVTLRIGQVTWFFLAIICLYYYCLVHRRPILAGISLAFSTVKPQYALFFMVPGLAMRCWKMLSSMVVTELLLLGLSVWSIGWQNVVHYPTVLFQAESLQGIGVAPESMICARGLLSNLLSQRLALQISLGLLVAALLLTFGIWRFAANTKRLTVNWAMAVTIVLALVFSPHTHIYDCLLLSLAAALTLPTLSLFVASDLSSLPLKIWSFLLIGYPVESWLLWVCKQRYCGWTVVPILIFDLLVLGAGLMYVIECVRSNQEAERNRERSSRLISDSNDGISNGLGK